MFQQRGFSSDLEEIEVPLASLSPRWENSLNDAPAAIVRVSRLLVACGLAESNSDGERKIKAGAVTIQGEDRGVSEMVLRGGGQRFPLGVRVGKRAKMVVIVIS
jgi:tyrosyl-tRNA synthetase